MAGWNGIFYNGVWCTGCDFLADGVIPSGNVFDVGSTNGSVNVGAAYARFSGKGVQINSTGTPEQIGRSFGINLPTVIGGFSFLTSNLPASTNTQWFQLIVWNDTVAGAGQLNLSYNNQGQFRFNQGGFGGNTALSSATSPGTVIANSTNYLEFVVTISSSSGLAQLYMNGSSTPLISFSGNTLSTVNAWTNQISYASNAPGGSAAHNFDDLYLLDTTGAAPYNTRLGNIRIQTDGPVEDSATSGLNKWTATNPEGTDYGNCANIPPNPAQYNYDSTVGDRMSFRYPTLSAQKVFFLNTWYSVEEDSAGSRAVVPIFRSNSVDQVGPVPVSLPASFTYYNQPSTIDPNTSASWASGTVTAAANCEIGLEIQS